MATAVSQTEVLNDEQVLFVIRRARRSASSSYHVRLLLPWPLWSARSMRSVLRWRPPMRLTVSSERRSPSSLLAASPVPKRITSAWPSSAIFAMPSVQAPVVSSRRVPDGLRDQEPARWHHFASLPHQFHLLLRQAHAQLHLSSGPLIDESALPWDSTDEVCGLWLTDLGSGSSLHAPDSLVSSTADIHFRPHGLNLSGFGRCQSRNTLIVFGGTSHDHASTQKTQVQKNTLHIQMCIRSSPQTLTRNETVNSRRKQQLQGRDSDRLHLSRWLCFHIAETVRSGSPCSGVRCRTCLVKRSSLNRRFRHTSRSIARISCGRSRSSRVPFVEHAISKKAWLSIVACVHVQPSSPPSHPAAWKR